jgi:excisionase family DNA binding protein
VKERLLTCKELAECLRVPVSWVYAQTRQKGTDTIPIIRVGKYCRFVEQDVLEWLRRRQSKR